jgi:putative ABC transport system ATP-binding protein
MPRGSVPALELRGARFAYPGASQPTLDIESLRIEAGQGLMLTGPSGGGKTTLLSLAAGVLLAQQGAVELMGQDWASLPTAARDAHRVDHVGYIFQQFNLLPYLGVLDNVLLPCGFSRRRRERATASQGSTRAAAIALLNALELPASLYHRPASDLSVGQQQRVAAARALIGQPDIVIADDRREAFMRLLMAQCAQAGSALLFVSHDTRLATHFGTVMDLPLINRARALACEAC